MRPSIRISLIVLIVKYQSNLVIVLVLVLDWFTVAFVFQSTNPSLQLHSLRPGAVGSPQKSCNWEVETVDH